MHTIGILQLLVALCAIREQPPYPQHGFTDVPLNMAAGFNIDALYLSGSTIHIEEFQSGSLANVSIPSENLEPLREYQMVTQFESEIHFTTGERVDLDAPELPDSANASVQKFRGSLLSDEGCSPYSNLEIELHFANGGQPSYHERVMYKTNDTFTNWGYMIPMGEIYTAKYHTYYGDEDLVIALVDGAGNTSPEMRVELVVEELGCGCSELRVTNPNLLVLFPILLLVTRRLTLRLT